MNDTTQLTAKAGPPATAAAQGATDGAQDTLSLIHI